MICTLTKYYLGYQIKNEMGGVQGTIGEGGGSYGVSVGKPEVKRSFGTPRRRTVNNIKIGS